MLVFVPAGELLCQPVRPDGAGGNPRAAPSRRTAPGDRGPGITANQDPVERLIDGGPDGHCHE